MTLSIRILALFSILAIPSSSLAAEQTALEEAWSALFGHSARDAVATAEQVTKTYPENAEAWLVRGRAFMRRAEEVNIFRKQSRLESALKAYQRATELDPANIEGQVILLSVYTNLPESFGGGKKRSAAQLEAMAAALPGLDELGRGFLARTEQNHELADAFTRRALEINPHEPQYWTSLVQHYAARENWDAAWKTLDEARAAFPDDIQLQHRVGRLAGESGQRLDDGLIMLEKLASQDDLPARFPPEALLLMRGRIMKHQGRFDEARSDFHQASETAPYLVKQMGFVDDIAALERGSG